jgi:outer membrane receptor protein involved in Fe transport
MRRPSKLAAGALALLVAGPALAEDIPWGGQVDGGAPGKGQKRKPFEPDTDTRLTGEELAEQGATNLAEALDLLPEVTVRTAGRGGLQADIRGGRKGWLKVLVDGVPVDDPYYGTFDLSSIPVTDIVEIRISTSPASPIDGAGGPGGVIEVITLRATGDRRVAARAQASDAPDAAAWVTGRAPLGGGLAMRVSGGGTFGGRDFDVAMPDGTSAIVGEDTRAANASLTLEHESETARYGLGLWAQHRSFVVPPGEDEGADVTVIDGENMARLSLYGELDPAGWHVLGRGYLHLMSRDSRIFDDAALDDVAGRETLTANKTGLGVWANRPLVPGLELVLSGAVDSEAADVGGAGGMTQGGRSTVGTVAGGVQWRGGPWRVDAAAGVAIPDGATPWPELKLSAAFAPVSAVELEVVGARKGRTPTLRERYALNIGNEGLAPETATYGEAAVTLRGGGVQVRGAAFWRQVDNMIRFDTERTMLENIGQVTLRGADLDAKVTPAPLGWLTVGAAWHFIDADSDTAGDEPLDFLPAHKLDGSVSLRWKRAGGTARVRWVDERLDQGETLPSFLTADASAWWAFLPTLRATMRIENVADERYLARANGYHDPGRLIMLGIEGVWQ